MVARQDDALEDFTVRTSLVPPEPGPEASERTVTNWELAGKVRGKDKDVEVRFW